MLAAMRRARRALFLLCGALGCGPAPTWSEHVAPIVQAKCQGCHRPGQIAPMSFQSYAEVRPFAPAIRAAVESGRMPPFYAAGPIGHWKQDIRLSESEKRLVLDWVEAGAPEGDPALLPPPPVFADSPWPLGEPDLVLRFPGHSPTPDQRDEWVTLFADQPFAEELWARAVHLRTTAAGAVHHATLSVVTPSTPVPAAGKTFDDVTAAVGGLYTWFPGVAVEPLPPGQAIRLRAGTRIVARTHFAPTRKAVVERMEVGIYLADGVVERMQKRIGIQFVREIAIPPGVADFALRGTKEFREDAEVTHFRVHMHVRGKSSRIRFRYPDGRVETVFDLPRYRFEWQRYYYLAEPLHVPKGTVAEFVGVWDNSASNPANPDPSAWCRWGPRTVDEMFGATVFYTPDRKMPVPLRVERGRAVGPAVAGAAPFRGPGDGATQEPDPDWREP
jgi:hypothetical protein